MTQQEQFTITDYPGASLIQPLVRWNGAGDSWESKDGGKSWVQTAVAPAFEGIAIWNSSAWSRINIEFPKEEKDADRQPL